MATTAVNDAAESSPSTDASERYALAVPLLAFTAATVNTIGQVLSQTQGRWIYALDDAYIHMSFARTLIEHGNWGVHPDHFANASSSPLWVITLAALRIMGLKDLGPLIAGFAFGVAAVTAADVLLRRWGVGAKARVVGTTIATLSVPLSLQVITGMEHLAMAAGTLTLLILATAPNTRNTNILLLATCTLLPLLRLEGLFLVGSVSTLMYSRGDRLRATLAACLATLPVAIWGAASLSQNWLALPNSVVLKSALSSESTGGFIAILSQRLLADITEAPELVAALTGISVLVVTCETKRSLREAAWVTVIAGFVHLLFARVGWFGRYESHLVFGSLVVLTGLSTMAWTRGGWRRTASVLVASLVCLAMFSRARTMEAERFDRVDLTLKGHIQMADLFLSLKPHGPLATTEAGAVTYLSQVDLVDLAGLADIEIARLRRASRFDADSVELRLTERRVEMVAVYRHFIGSNGIDRIPHSWRPVAEWHERGRHQSADLLFYARTADAAHRLSAAMVERSGMLSLTTEQRILWTPNSPRALPPRFIAGTGGAHGDGWALYTNGIMEWTVPECGTVMIELQGERVAGEGPLASVYRGTKLEREIEIEVPVAGFRIMEQLTQGERIRVAFKNDLDGGAEGDRNLLARSATFTPGCD